MLGFTPWPTPHSENSFPDAANELHSETKAGIPGYSAGDLRETVEEVYHEYRLKGRITYNEDEARID